MQSKELYRECDVWRLRRCAPARRQNARTFVKDKESEWAHEKKPHQNERVCTPISAAKP